MITEAVLVDRLDRLAIQLFLSEVLRRNKENINITDVMDEVVHAWYNDNGPDADDVRRQFRREAVERARTFLTMFDINIHSMNVVEIKLLNKAA